MSLTVGSLFAGIGGFDLGFERAGFEIKWQVEIDEFARRVLERHWPGVTRYGDIRSLDWADVEPVDIVVGGFPCQPHSSAGRRLAAADDRDLWPDFCRCVRALRPRWFVGENVSGLLSSDAGRFFGGILRDVAESGYVCEWDSLPASAVGAPHKRDRVWLVGYRAGTARGVLAHPARQQLAALAEGARATQEQPAIAGLCAPVSHADRGRQQERAELDGAPQADSADRDSCRGHLDGCHCAGWWDVEPDVGRVAHGVPARVDRLRGLGNAIVPQIAQWIAERIQAAEGRA